MIFDKLLMTSNAQVVTVSAASTDVIDLGIASDLAPALEDLKLVCQVGTAFAGGISLAVSIETSVDNSTWTMLASSRAVPVAALTAGANIGMMSLGSVGAGVTPGRYLRTYYTVVGTMSAGTITCGFVLDRQSNRPYPGGVVAST